MYATLEEAWGMTTIIHSPPNNVFEDKEVQRQVLGSNSTPDDYTQKSVRRFISEEYRKHGLGGILPLLDTTILRDLQTPVQGAPGGGWLGTDTDIFILIAAFALLMIMDRSA
jgi:hypothetical protein